MTKTDGRQGHRQKADINRDDQWQAEMAGRQIRKREEIEGTEGHGAGGAGTGQQRVQEHEPERRNGQERDQQQDLQMRGRSPGPLESSWD